jgi:hypothetical protein
MRPEMKRNRIFALFEFDDNEAAKDAERCGDKKNEAALVSAASDV